MDGRNGLGTTNGTTGSNGLNNTTDTTTDTKPSMMEKQASYLRAFSH